MLKMIKEVRRGRGRESKLEGVNGLTVGDGMRVGGDVIGCPRGFEGSGMLEEVRKRNS
jgi:hypothetical protein